MDNAFYRNILYNSPIGYAYHEVIFDSKGVPCDYRFIEVNPAFELFTGLLTKDIVGKTVLEVMPDIVKDDFDWIAFYGEIALNNQIEKFEGYSSVLKSWYKVEVFSPKKNYFITIFSDVTSIKKQNEDLIELESIFSSVIKNAPIPIMIHSNDGKVLNLSNAWKDITGYSHEDIPTIDKWTKAAYGKNQKAVIDFIDKLYDLNKPQHDGEFPINTKDNKKLLWDFYSTYIGQTPDNTRMAMSVAIDVTEERKNKDELIRERLLFETTLLSVGDGVICTNRLGEITLINEIAEQLTGWSKKDALGKKIEKVFAIYSESTGKASDNIVDKVMSTGIIHELANHTVLRSKDGTERPIADSAAPIILSNGDVIGAVLVFRDYSEKYNSQKEIEALVKNLQETQILLQASLNSPVDIIILSLDKDYKYLYFNEAHRISMKLSYNTDVEVGKCIFDYITSPDDIQRIKANYDIALSGVSHMTSEQYGDLDVSVFETLFNPIKDADDKIIGVSAYARDVSERARVAKALKDEKELAQEYLNIAAVMIMVLNEKGNITLINKEGCNILGLDEKDIIGKNWFENFLPKDVIEPVKEVFNNVFKKDGELGKNYENTIITARGEVKIISWHNSILYDSQKNPIGIISSGDDITEIKLTEQKLKENEKRYRELIENLDTGIVVHASDTSITSFNRRAEEMLGLSYNELSGKSVSSIEFSFIDINYNKLAIEAYPASIIIRDRKPIRDHIFGIKHIHDNNVIWVSVNGVPILNDDSSIKEVVISFVDISQQKLRQDEIIHLSNHDYLTNLYNRRFFVERYKELDNKQFYPLGIMMIDVNGLKIINDAFGHDAGDNALKKVSEILCKSCRKQDIICRIGGDEFAIILPNVTESELKSINESIRIETKNSEIESVLLSLAIGYEIKTENVKGNLDEILKSAENQMYRHKLAEGISIRNNAIKAILKTLTNKYTSERIHSEKVSELCKKMGEVLSLNEDDIKELELAGMYHDIGKISIPDAILNKPGRLTKEEFDIIKTHPEISYQILRAADEYSDLAIHALYHHERWDGNGYPVGKKGEEIPLFSRIICIIDAFEAMTADRVYKNKMSVDSAVEELIRCAGTQFDESLTKTFVEKVLHRNWN